MLALALKSQSLLSRSPFTWPPPVAEALPRRVLISGGGGDVATGIATAWNALGVKNFALVDQDDLRLLEAAEHLTALGASVECYLGDATQPEWLSQITTRYAPDCFVHCAVLKAAPLLESHPLQAYVTNSESVATAAFAAGRAGCRSFLLPSSTEAYSHEAIFGASKLLGEYHALRAAQLFPDMRVCVLRFGAVLLSSGSAGLNFYLRALEGRPITILRADIRRSFFSLEEVSSAMTALLLSDAPSGQLHQLELPEPTRLLELAERIVNATGSTSEISVGGGLRPGDFAVPPGLAEMHGVEACSIPHLYRVAAELGELESVAHLCAQSAAAHDSDGVALQFRRLISNGSGKTT